MTERRPHWDDDLIEAVDRALYETGTMYALIAAVEDWLVQTQDDLSLVDTIFAKARAEKAEAAIRQVREVCDLWQRRHDSASAPWKEMSMSERRECFCGRRTVFEFGLTDDDGNAHTWRACGKDEDGKGLDVNTLLSERMEQVERAEKAEAALQRVRKKHTICETKRGAVCRQCEDPWPCPTIRALDGDGDE